MDGVPLFSDAESDHFAVNNPFNSLLLIHDKKFRACAGQRAMGRIAKVGDGIAHARSKAEGASVTQLSLQFTFENEKDMASVAPMIG
jgi:hypothetical protein